jgi:lipopolysaccharide/colanic/teichoic acid biosynthesis glycosyltransferase
MVKPGLIAREVGNYSQTDYEQWVILDWNYIVACSFWMDVLILLKKIPAAICSMGVYLEEG